MKILSLNCWKGVKLDLLLEYIKNKSSEVDVFCLQEMTSSNETNSIEAKGEGTVVISDLFEKLVDLLPDFDCHFAGAQELAQDVGSSKGYDFGLAILVKKGVEYTVPKDFYMFGQKNGIIPGFNQSIGKNVQYSFLTSGDKKLLVLNFHGLWAGVGVGKIDIPSRLFQSKNLRDFIDAQDCPFVLMGDFNLMPSTKSLQMLSVGNVDLIEKYAVTDTRGVHYPKSERFADYTIVSKDLKVTGFAVEDVPVSDHLPMIVDIDF